MQSRAISVSKGLVITGEAQCGVGSPGPRTTMSPRVAQVEVSDTASEALRLVAPTARGRGLPASTMPFGRSRGCAWGVLRRPRQATFSHILAPTYDDSGL
jgi:hypothetical protein